MSYTKLFRSILHSTVWLTPGHVRLVWITMLASCDQDGVVESSVPGLANLAGVTRPEVEEALAILLAPDPDSRTPDCEGRRIEAIDGGWRLINHGKYRDKLDADEIRAKAAERQQRKRDRDRKREETPISSRDASRDITPRHAESRESRKVTTSDQAQAQAHIKSDQSKISERARDSELAAKLTRPPSPTPDPTRAREVEVAGRLCELHRELVGRPWTAPSQLLQALDGLGPLSRSPHPEHVRAISAHFEGPDSLAMVERAFRGFVADGWAKSKGYPMAAFAKDPQRYLAAPTKPASEVGDFSHASTTGELL